MWTLLTCFTAILSLLAFVIAQEQAPFSDVTTPAPKYVVAHFIVGNTYPYTVDDWSKGQPLLPINCMSLTLL